MYINHIALRDEDIFSECKCCGHIQMLPKTIDPIEFANLPEYLDSFKKGLEKKYFEFSFSVCDNCCNFGIENLNSLIFKKFDNKKIKEIINSNKEKLEKALIISNIIYKNSVSTLLELYWYYDFNKPNSEELVKTRNKLIKALKKQLKDKRYRMYTRLILVDLYRRSSDFKTAKIYAEKWSDITTVHDKEILEKQKELCDKQDADRH